MQKKLLSLVLALSLVMSQGVGVAFAAVATPTALVSTADELVKALANEAVTEIDFVASIETTNQVTVSRPVVIDGKGFELTLGKALSTVNGYKHILGIQEVTGAVEVKNLTIDSIVPTDTAGSHGVNVYQSDDVRFENVVMMNSRGAGLTVNASSVVAAGVTTLNSAWGVGVNVDLGSAVFECEGTANVFTETHQIKSDKGGVTVIAPAGFESYTVGGVTLWELALNVSFQAQTVLDGTFAAIPGSYQKVYYGNAASAPATTTVPAPVGYHLSGWDKSAASVTESYDFKAQYEINQYTVTFNDGSKITSVETTHGTAAVAPAPSEVKGMDFVKWDKDFSNVTGVLTVTAEYAPKHYTVTFENFDGAVLSSEEVTFNVAASQPEDPTFGIFFSPEFLGWGAEYDVAAGEWILWNFETAVDADITLTAVYDVQWFDVSFEDGKGSEIASETVYPLQGVAAPEAPVAPAHQHFVAWVDADGTAVDLAKVESDLVLFPSYAWDTFVVTFVGFEGAILSTPTVSYNTSATAPATAVEGYTFVKWDVPFVAITADTTVTASYEINKYGVTFVDWDNTVLSTQTVSWNTSATAPSVEPTRAGNTFAGWDVPFDVITADTTVTATYLPFVDGISGASKYDTSAAAALAAYPGGVTTVILATGNHWADALGGSALAGALDAPIMLVDGDVLPASVAAALETLAPSNIIILGGNVAVSAALEAALKADYSVERIFGASQYDTADAVATRVIEANGAWDGTAFFATGEFYADALAVSPIAAAIKAPVYLVNPFTGDLSAGAKAELANITNAIVLGGKVAVPMAIETALGEAFTERISGSNWDDTAAAIAQYGVDSCGLSWNRVAIATGEAPYDALCGGIVQANRGSVLLLTKSASLSAAAGAKIETNKAEITSVTYFGGTFAVSQAVRDAVEVKLGRL